MIDFENLQMMWLFPNEFWTIIKKDVLEDVLEDDVSILLEAERQAVAEAQAYLRAKNYDVAIIFSDKNNKDDYLKMIVIDLMMFHLHSRIISMKTPDVRLIRFDDAKKALSSLGKDIDLALPKVVNQETGSAKTKRVNHQVEERRGY